MAMWTRVASEATAAGVGASATMSVAFGCPYEGVVAPDRVREIARRLASAGPFEVSLADTIGSRSPLKSSCWCGASLQTPGCR